jgi:hypothetical protein
LPIGLGVATDVVAASATAIAAAAAAISLVAYTLQRALAAYLNAHNQEPSSSSESGHATSVELCYCYR